MKPWSKNGLKCCDHVICWSNPPSQHHTHNIIMTILIWSRDVGILLISLWSWSQTQNHRGSFWSPLFASNSALAPSDSWENLRAFSSPTAVTHRTPWEHEGDEVHRHPSGIWPSTSLPSLQAHILASTQWLPRVQLDSPLLAALSSGEHCKSQDSGEDRLGVPHSTACMHGQTTSTFLQQGSFLWIPPWRSRTTRDS